MAKFSGKTALVTGAGSGIGHCISLQLAREGAYIVVVDLDKNAANLTLSKITANGGSGEILVCDISNNSDVTAFVQDLLEHHKYYSSHLSQHYLDYSLNLKQNYLLA